MKKKHNFVWASNLIFISAAFGLLNFLFLTPPKSTYEISVGLIVILFVVGLALLVRKAYKWVKWGALVLILLGVLATIIVLPEILHQNLITLIISLSQAILQIIAVVLMFLPYNLAPDNSELKLK